MPAKKHTYHYRRLLREIRKIKAIEQTDVVAKNIQNTFDTHRIGPEEYEDLFSKLSERVLEIRSGGRLK